ncbi:hypothetical protein L7F22_030850 [Adiantum nelumboides]|nr:hypothetical protein [Adiantum nelumboides]
MAAATFDEVGSDDSIQQLGQAGGMDQAEIVWSKMQTLKEKYFEDMKDLFNMLATKSRQAMPQEQLHKLNHYKTVLQRMMPYLVAAKGALPKEFKQDKVEAFEKQIVSIMETFKRRRQLPQQSQQQATLGQAQAGQQPQQAPQNLQADVKSGQIPQMNSPLSAAAELQSNNASNNSFPFLQSNVTSIQQAMGVATQPSPLNNLAGANATALHQNNTASFPQNAINPLQMNVAGIQPQQQDQHFHQNRLFKDQEQSKQLQVRQLQQQQQQHQLQKQQAHLAQQTQLQPLSADASTDSKMVKHAALMKQMLLNQTHQQVNTRNILQQLQQQQQQQQQQKGPSLHAAASPQTPPPSQLSPQNDLQNMANSALLIPKVGTPLQASTPPFMAPSPSPVAEDSEIKPSTPAVPVAAPLVGGQVFHSAVATPSGPSAAIGTPGLSVSPLLDCTPSPQITNLQDRAQTYVAGSADERQSITEPPMKRLIRAINNMSPRALDSAVADMSLLVNLADKLGGSAPGAQSRAAVGEDLAQLTKCRTQARVLSSPDGGAIAKKVRRRVDSLALSLISSDGSVVNSLQKMRSPELETESTATSKIKRSRLEINLLEEIDRINDKLIETRVEIDPQGNKKAASDGKDGIAVKCVYNAISVKPNSNLRNNSLHIAFPPLRLLIPPQYPHCSPILLEDESAPSSNDLLPVQAWETFKRTARGLPQPVLLGDMVKAWDSSAYDTILEAAIGQGGGSFSSRYGTWKPCVYT